VNVIPAQEAQMHTLFRPADTGHVLSIHDDIEPEAGDVPFGKVVPRLQLFWALMQAQGWHVDMQRMLYDRVYACERLALAHTCADDALRALSVKLFGQYQH
jgi:hypothetical protein